MNTSARLIITVLLILSSVPAFAGDYRVSVTRKGSNLYKVTGEDVYILTRLCYEYVYYADAILSLNGSTGELRFLNERRTCGVKAAYGPADIRPGRYSVVIAWESDDWYSVSGAETFIKTSLCLSLALGEEVVMEVVRGGGGRLYFQDGNECSIEGLYVRLKD
jgi:hypothetical protein